MAIISGGSGMFIEQPKGDVTFIPTRPFSPNDLKRGESAPAPVKEEGATNVKDWVARQKENYAGSGITFPEKKAEPPQPPEKDKCHKKKNRKMQGEKIPLVLEGNKPVTLEGIRAAVALHSNMSVSRVKSKEKAKSVLRARRLGMFMANEMLDMCLAEIGEGFGIKTDSIVEDAIKNFRRWWPNNPHLRNDAGAILKILAG